MDQRAIHERVWQLQSKNPALKWLDAIQQATDEYFARERARLESFKPKRADAPSVRTVAPPYALDDRDCLFLIHIGVKLEVEDYAGRL